MIAIGIGQPPNFAAVITAPKREVDDDRRQERDDGRNRRIHDLVSRTVHVKLQPGGPDGHARADDDEERVVLWGSKIRPDKASKRSVEHQCEEEAESE